MRTIFTCAQGSYLECYFDSIGQLFPQYYRSFRTCWVYDEMLCIEKELMKWQNSYHISNFDMYTYNIINIQLIAA